MKNPLPGVAVACTCRGAICGESPLGPKLYRCAACRRLVPWCFGAADDKPDECDDCWWERQERQERRDEFAAQLAAVMAPHFDERGMLKGDPR